MVGSGSGRRKRTGQLLGAIHHLSREVCTKNLEKALLEAQHEILFRPPAQKTHYPASHQPYCQRADLGHTHRRFGAFSVRQWFSEFLYISPTRPDLGVRVGSAEVGIAAPGGPQDPARFRNVWIPWGKSRRRQKSKTVSKRKHGNACARRGVACIQSDLLKIHPSRACRLQGRGPQPDLFSVTEF